MRRVILGHEKRRPILLLFNPAAGEKRNAAGAARAVSSSEVLGALRRNGLVVDLRELTPEDDPEDLARWAAEDGRDIVAAGGDGTAGPAAKGLIGMPATLGIIPLGTFNNIARGVGLPLEPERAIEVVATGRSRPIDAGVAWPLAAGDAAIVTERMDELEPAQDAAFFFEAAGVGFDAAGFGVARVGERLGLLAAARAAWRAIGSRKTPVWLVVDGQRYRTLSPAVTVCNGPFLGFGFALAPEADPTDGMLDVVVFLRMTRLEVLRHFARVAGGRPRREPRVRTLRARRIVVGGQRHPLAAHADGRPIGVTPIAVTVRHAAVRVFS